MNSKRRAAQRGMTLMETLVAVAIFAIVFLAALTLYTSANRAYLQTDAAAVQQQNVRFAMDRMMQTLHDAGAGYNALGSAKLADEQIEGAWDAAIFTRGDFDNQRENTGTSLESATFPIITTGNDEIVGYVLLKNGTGSVPISIKADFSAPRDAIYTTQTNITGEETKTINVAAATVAEQTNPPYQLARVTFNAAGAAQYEIIAENIYRMKFEYYGATGNSAILGASAGTGGADNERDERAAVRRIRVRLMGMADRPDFGYKDPWQYGSNFSDLQSTIGENYHKFALEETVLSPNLGIKGRKHKPTPALSLDAPTGITVCTGHSRLFYVRWNASTSPGVNEYSLHVSAPAAGTLAPVDENLSVLGGLLYKEYKLPIESETEGQRSYSFQVAAATTGVNGTYGPIASLASAHEATPSTPQAPQSVAAAGTAGANTLTVSWTAVTQSTGTIAGSNCVTQGTGVSTGQDATWAQAAPDLKGYHIYRLRAGETGANQNFDVTTPGRQVDNSTTNPTPSASATTFPDSTSSPCEPYYYKVEAFDNGGRSNVSNGIGPVSSPDPGSNPEAPGGVNAANAISGFYTTPNSSIYRVNLSWPQSTKTVAGAAALAVHYQVIREISVNGSAGPWSTDNDFDVYATTFMDEPSQKRGPDNAIYRYYVKAVYTNCGPRYSTSAGPYTMVSCTAANSVTINMPTSGMEISTPFESGFTPQVAIATSAGQTINSVTAVITGPDGQNNVIWADNQTPATVTPSTTVTFQPWNGAADVQLGTYTFSAYAIINNCKTATVTRSFVLGYATCSLQVLDNALTLSPSSGSTKYYQLAFRIQNTCDPLQGGINFVTTGMSLTFTGYGGTRTIKELRLTDPVTGTLITASPISPAPGSGQAFTFASNQTINAGATTALWYVIFSDEMKSGNNSGCCTTFSSIILNTTTPANANDQILSGSVTP